jgi:hypothetical protein
MIIPRSITSSGLAMGTSTAGGISSAMGLVGGGLSAVLDFTQSPRPQRAIPYTNGSLYSFARNSTVWCPVYDTATQSLKWVEIPANVPPMPGMRWDADAKVYSPYDEHLNPIPASFLKGYWYLPQAVNSVAYSRKFDGTGWAFTGTLTITKDQIGFDGTANSASTLTDTDTTKTSFAQVTATVANDSSTHCIAVLIGKDSNESRYPMIRAALIGGTGIVVNYLVNTKTGATHQVTNSAGGTFSINDFNENFWQAQLFIPNNGTGNTTLTAQLYPAAENSFTGGGTSEVTGSTVFDQFEIRLNTSFYDGSPIVTNGNAVTRLDGNYSLAYANHKQAVGMILCEMESGIASSLINSVDNRLITNFNGSGPGQLYFTSSAIYSYDSSSKVNVSGINLNPGTVNKIALRWSGTSRAVIVNGVEGSGLYDGSFPGPGAENSIIIAVNNPVPFYLKSLKYYQVDRGTAWIQGQQS